MDAKLKIKEIFLAKERENNYLYMFIYFTKQFVMPDKPKDPITSDPETRGGESTSTIKR